MKNTLVIILLIFNSFLFGQNQITSAEVEIRKENNIDLIYYKNHLYSGVITEYYETGKPKRFTTIKNGMADGLWQEWYQNGNLKFDANWKQGKGHGLWRYFHENGKIRQEEFYNMDRPIGIFRSYYNKGKLKTITYGLDGKKQAYTKHYSETGMLIENQTL